MVRPEVGSSRELPTSAAFKSDTYVACRPLGGMRKFAHPQDFASRRNLVHEDELELDASLRILSHKQPLRAGPVEGTLATQRFTEDATMPQVKQASKQRRVTKAAIPALGAAGLTFSLLGSASASAVPTADVPRTTHFAPNEAITLGEGEMADVSLATFHLFDKENIGSGVQVAWRGCGGCRGCRGCGVRGCRCGGCAGCGGCCRAWGRCRWC